MRKLLSLIFLFAAGPVLAAPAETVTFTPSTRTVDAYDFVEVVIRVAAPASVNPFTGVTVTGEFQRKGAAPMPVDGFCDAADGSLFRIRFMPSQPGSYDYTVKYQRGDVAQTHNGSFMARKGTRRGGVRVDKNYPWHFVWEGTGEHYFWNATTTYALMGWKDDAIIRESIDRLARLKVNRLRVAIIPPRVESGQQWYEPMVVTNDQFTFRLNAWMAARPDSLDDPGFDVTRFNVEYWQKYERMLRHAREKNIAVSVIFYVDGRLPGVDPFKKERMGGEDEQRYYRYAAARLAAYANVMWDVSNEYRHFRDDAWAEKIGAFLKDCNPYDHLTSIHGYGDFRFMKSPWADFAMYQSWDEHGGYKFMLKNREKQAATGRPMPQVNEEYGYEDHYPGPWGEGRKWPARIADSRRRLAWEMYMAGGYQTTGERANSPRTGGWINGRGDEQMTMLIGYGHIYDFFMRTEWWKTAPNNALVDGDNLCLAEPGRQYIVYLPKGGKVMVKLEPGNYRASRYDPLTGKLSEIGDVTGGPWTAPESHPQQDWVLWIRT